MDDQRQEINLGFTREHLPESGHMCLIYDNEAQRRKIVSEYLAAGLKQGDLIRYFTDMATPEEVCAWLSEMGVELPESREGGSFSIIKAEKHYCPSGHFVPQEVLDGMVSRYAMAKEAGYSGSRATSEMTWALKDIPGVNRFLEYEALINMIPHTFPFTGMCQYDARRFDGATLFQVLQVHPYMVAQGQVVRNPFYIRPEEFLAKFRSNA